MAERDNNLASAHTLLPPPPEDDDGNEQFDPFDEDSRFEMHRVSMIDDSLQRLASIRGVKSVTVVELATGRVILSTLKDAAAAEIGAVAPSLLQRAASSSRDVAASLSNADGGSSSSKKGPYLSSSQALPASARASSRVSDSSMRDGLPAVEALAPMLRRARGRRRTSPAVAR